MEKFTPITELVPGAKVIGQYDRIFSDQDVLSQVETYKNKKVSCGHTLYSARPELIFYSTGVLNANTYAVLPNGDHVCADCALETEKSAMHLAEQKYSAYVDRRMENIVTFLGGRLAVIISIKHNPVYKTFTAMDDHGDLWTGRFGGTGTLIKVKRKKVRTYL